MCGQVHCYVKRRRVQCSVQFIEERLGWDFKH